MLNYHKQNQLWICFKTLQVRNNFERIYERFLISKSKSARRGNWQCQNYCTQLSSIRWIQPLLKNWQCQNYCTQIFKFGEYGHCWKALYTPCRCWLYGSGKISEDNFNVRNLRMCQSFHWVLQICEYAFQNASNVKRSARFEQWRLSTGKAHNQI